MITQIDSNFCIFASISITPNQRLARGPVSLEVPVGTPRVGALVTMPMASRHESRTSGRQMMGGGNGEKKIADDGCFNWMMPNLDLGNGCLTKHAS